MASGMEITSVQIAFIGLLITAGGTLWALFRLVTTSADSVRREMMAEIEKSATAAAKGKHDLANQMQLSFGKMESEIDRLKRETVRREDMAAIENRLGAMFTKIETKVDNITDKLAGFTILEKQVQSIDKRLDDAIRRLETGVASRVRE